MSKLRCHISTSLDGFVAGPNQSEENPLGEGGERLHEWIVPLAAWREAHDKQGGEVNESARIVEESRENIGAGIMGRNMFGPISGGDWGDERWEGWWGDNPPYHNDVFVVTHHPREPVEMQGGTTYYFATDGIERALERAKASAASHDVMLWGGAQIMNQYLAAGSWTNSSCTSFRCSSEAAPACSKTSGAPRSNSSRSGRLRRPASRTSNTGSQHKPDRRP
ncbi:MAG TPA: dihydrofolate reductase family protein [Solirubrobacteraceae bacterium]